MYSGNRCAVLSGPGVSWRSLFHRIESACSEFAPVMAANPSGPGEARRQERVVVDQVEVVPGIGGQFQARVRGEGAGTVNVLPVIASPVPVLDAVPEQRRAERPPRFRVQRVPVLDFRPVPAAAHRVERHGGVAPAVDHLVVRQLQRISPGPVGGDVRQQESALPRHLDGKRPPRHPQDGDAPDPERDVLPDRVLVEGDPRPPHLEIPVRLGIARAGGQHPLFDQERTLPRLLDLLARDEVVAAADPDVAVVEDSRLGVEVDRDAVERELLVRVLVPHLAGQVRLSGRRIVPDPVGAHRPVPERHLDVPLREGDPGLLVVIQRVGGHVDRGVETDPRSREILQDGRKGKPHLRGDVRHARGDQQETGDEATERGQGTKPTRCR